MKEYLRAVGYAMITIVAVLFGMGLVEFGYLTAAVYFGLTKGQAAAAILGISLVAGAVMTARSGGGNGAVARPWKRRSNCGRPLWQTGIRVAGKVSGNAFALFTPWPFRQ